MEMAGLRPAMRSAVMRAEPCDMVQPIWPCPVLKKRFREPPPAVQREVGRRHRPEAGGHFGAVVLVAVRIEFLRHPLHGKDEVVLGLQLVS